MSKIFGATLLTGGSSGAVDSILVTGPNYTLAVGMICRATIYGAGTYEYVVVASGSTESSPAIIKPNNDSVGVPYTGNLRWHLTGVFAPWIQLDTTFANSTVEGRLQWNTEDGTMEYGLPGGNVVLQVGQEHLIRATNKTGADIGDGKVVYISGALGNRPLITLAKADAPASSVQLGMTTESIDDNEIGYININGLVRNINTDAITAGAVGFLSETTAGELRSTPPAAPNFTAVVGVCVVKGVENGIFLIRTLTSPRLVSLSDVNHTAPGDGQIPKWIAANSRFEFKDIFTERADPSAVDFDTFTKDDGWHDLDLSSIALAGAKSVLLEINAQNNTLGAEFVFRKKGNSNEIITPGLKVLVADTVIKKQRVVLCDSDRIIQYKISSTGTWASHDVTVAGYWT